MLTHLIATEWELRGVMQRVKIQEQHRNKYVASLRTQLTLIQKIKECQIADTGLQLIKEGME